LTMIFLSLVRNLGFIEMKRADKVFSLMEKFAQERFEQSQVLIEKYFDKNAEEIAAVIVSAFSEAFSQAAQLQQTSDKGFARYLVISHLYSSIQSGGYCLKLDVFDQSFYADIHEVDVYLSLNWLHKYFEEDILYFKEKLLAANVYRIREYEIEQVRYRYIYYYHGIVKKIITDNITELMSLIEVCGMAVDSEFEVMFGGYLDKAVVIYPEAERV